MKECRLMDGHARNVLKKVTQIACTIFKANMSATQLPALPLSVVQIIA